MWGRVRNDDQKPKEDSGRKKGKGGAGVAVPVVAAKARAGSISIYFHGLGNVIPINTVTVRSRVDGELVRVLYKEGDLVEKYQLLAEIDPRPYQVQLNQAKAQQSRDQATLNNARTDLGRYQTLLTQNAIAEQQVATQRATVEQAEALVKSDQAQIDAASLNLTFTRITAPITGRVGLRLVDPGNIIRAADANGLVVITQIDPISVIFTITQDQLPQVLGKLKAGRSLVVDAFDRDMQNRIAQGRLATVDNEIDQTTGTVRLRATFDNNNGALFPNQFVNARMLVEQKHNVVLLPSAAIQRSTNGSFAYVVNGDGSVAVRQITVGTTEGDDSEITSGLKAGEVVVMTGVDKLQEGTKVNPHFEDKDGAGGQKRGKR